MCLYSAHVPVAKRREAVPGETLTLGRYANHICFIGADNKVVCIRGGTKLVLSKIEKSFSGSYPESVKFGRQATVVFTEGAKRYSCDSFIHNGVSLHIGWFKQGMKAKVWKAPTKKRIVRITGKKGMTAIQSAVTEAIKVSLAEMPDEKPARAPRVKA